MAKILDLKKSVYEICAEYPEAKDILAEAGFHDIVKLGILGTVGKYMTIPRGASLRGIDLSKVIIAFSAKGFEIEDAK